MTFRLNKIAYSLILLLLLGAGLFLAMPYRSKPPLISLFPLDHYNQSISAWIKSSDPGYNQRLVSGDYQQKRLDDFYTHYFGDRSPWDASYIMRVLHEAPPDDIKSSIQDVISTYGNSDPSKEDIGYGENFRPYSKEWMGAIAENSDVEQFSHLDFQETNRGIAIHNTYARALPTIDPHFYSYKIAGQGYPFDNLQASALWVGTPVYIVGQTRDHAWYLVVTPDFILWVKSNDIARVDTAFVKQWTQAAKNHLAALTRTKTPIVDEHGVYHFAAFVGTVFPYVEEAKKIKMMIPVANANHQANIVYASVAEQDMVKMPLALTPHNMASIMQTLISRPYGWGGIYFNNDCSAELKSLFTPFGIWLPRHSSEQVTVGKQVNLTAAPPSERLAYLMKEGKPFLTIVYIGGHIFLYVGNYPNPNSPHHEQMAMTYQDMWGLKPNPPVRRAVVGQSVLFPLLLNYPEDTSLVSQANRKYFIMAFLDELPNEDGSSGKINVKAMTHPDYDSVISSLINPVIN